MSGQPSVTELLQRNERLSAWYRPQKYFAELNTPNKPKILIEALSFRNVGGKVDSIINDLVSLDFMLNFEHVIVIHHTDCALLHFTADNVRQKLQQQLPELTKTEVDSLALPDFSELEESVREDVRTLKNYKFLRQGLKDGVLGFVYDVKSGLLKKIE
ncbi:hypothetical protein S7711_11408 [Stachybotrys chartarum IBT 7711]|uniref:Carbonic anhydrase n=1 Tax=Stachybotrys chartarum (strain CBS 109288 / IBT 7711) TaxID=1280523 RepID=A0A084APX1_STACB|nr:hypothetical protein S7711_11408 [Stachybotrys chartarum IBT 7711]KFA47656.1 hypothetical protein S40293_11208 [Stachybotrys chartarum IBT 40293]KFA75072.1 hypothetical protein S40288_11154 [Stachybotrys chartarum IBT 40288]